MFKLNKIVNFRTFCDKRSAHRYFKRGFYFVLTYRSSEYAHTYELFLSLCGATPKFAQKMLLFMCLLRKHS